MKRLLFFLLLLAISGCSNNLSYKTKEGKKNFIREDTVQLQKLTRDDFKEKYEKFIADKSKSFQSEITNINRKIKVLGNVANCRSTKRVETIHIALVIYTKQFITKIVRL